MKILKLVASTTRWESGGVPLAGGRIQSPFSLSPKDCHFTQRHSVFVAKNYHSFWKPFRKNIYLRTFLFIKNLGYAETSDFELCSRHLETSLLSKSSLLGELLFPPGSLGKDCELTLYCGSRSCTWTLWVPGTTPSSMLLLWGKIDHQQSFPRPSQLQLLGSTKKNQLSCFPGTVRPLSSEWGIVKSLPPRFLVETCDSLWWRAVLSRRWVLALLGQLPQTFCYASGFGVMVAMRLLPDQFHGMAGCLPRRLCSWLWTIKIHFPGLKTLYFQGHLPFH